MRIQSSRDLELRSGGRIVRLSAGEIYDLDGAELVEAQERGASPADTVAEIPVTKKESKHAKN